MTTWFAMAQLFMALIGCFVALLSSSNARAGTELNDKLIPDGEWVEAKMPATLDLTANAVLAINCLTRGVDAANGYLVYERLCFGRQAPTTQWELQLFPTGISPCMHLAALPQLRRMTGSDLNLDVEAAMMDAQISWIDEEGLLIYPDGDSIIPAGASYPSAAGHTVVALLEWHARDGDEQWLKAARKLVGGLSKYAVAAGEQVYYPPESGVTPSGQWLSEPRWRDKLLTKPPVVYQPPREPSAEHVGYKGSVLYDQAAPLTALVTAGKAFNDPVAMETATRLARFMLRPHFWENSLSTEHAPDFVHWKGSVAGHLAALRALLAYVRATNDDALIQRITAGYEHARELGVPAIGWYPHWAPTRAHGYPGMLSTWGETCATANGIMLAIDLSDAGAGDYWDDVARAARNQLVEQQFGDLAAMQAAASRGSPPIEFDKLASADVVQGQGLLGRFLGGFGGGKPTSAGIVYMDNNSVIDACCTANGSLALYRVWEAITRFDGSTATVNLLLNRSSPWLIIESWLPHEGKVRLRNRQAKRIRIRLPDHVDPADVKVARIVEAIVVTQEGQWLTVDGMKPRDEIVIEFNSTERTERFTVDRKEYKATFMGNTVIDIEPRRDDDPYVIPLYVNRPARGAMTPLRTVRHFVSN